MLNVAAGSPMDAELCGGVGQAPGELSLAVREVSSCMEAQWGEVWPRALQALLSCHGEVTLPLLSGQHRGVTYHSCLSGGMVPVSAKFKCIISSKDAVTKIRHTNSLQLNNLFFNFFYLLF